SHGNRFKIASGQSAVSGESFGEDQKVFFLLCDPIVVGTQQSADIRERVFLRRESAAIGVGKDGLRDLLRSQSVESGFLIADEPRVLREAARIEIKRDSVL